MRIPYNIIERLEAVRIIVSTDCDQQELHCAHEELDSIIEELKILYSKEGE